MGPRSVSAASDKDKTREQLLDELEELRARNALLEAGRDGPLNADFMDNESMTRLLLNQKLYGVWVNVGGRITYINEVGAHILGASNPADVIGKSVLDEIIHPDYRNMVRDRIKTMTGGGSDAPLLEEKYVRVDGSAVDVDVWAISFVYQGEPAILVAFKDITERKQNELALAKEKHILMKSQEVAHVGNWTYDLRTGILTGSAENDRIFGYEPGDGTRTMEWVLSRVLPEDRRTLAEFVDACSKYGKQGSLDYRIVRPDGSIGYMNVIVDKAVRDKVGKIIRLYGISQDITERKRAEVALQESHVLLDAITDNTPDHVYIKDREGRFIFANPAVVSFFGLSREALIGRDPLDLTDDAAMVAAIIENDRRVMESGQTSVFEEVVRTVHGPRTFLSTKTPYRNDKGEVIGLIGISIDITERKKAEEALLESKAQLEAVFSSMNDGIIIFDTNGKATSANNAAVQFHRFRSMDELLTSLNGYLELLDTCNMDGSQLTPDKWPANRALRGEMVFNQDIAITRRDTGESWVGNSSAAPIRDERGNVVGAVVTMRDVTERKQAEEAVQKSEEKYRRLVEMANEGIWMLDRDNVTTFVNPRMAGMLGYTPEEMVGRRPDVFLDDAYREEARNRLDTRHRGGREQYTCKYKRKDGGDLWAIVSGTPLYDGNGEYIGAMAMITDITERKQAEEALQESEERFRVFMNNSSAIAWMKDAQGQYVYINKAYQDELGVRPEDRLGKTDFEIWPRKLAEEFRTSDLKVMVGGRPAYVIEETPNSDGNTTYWFDVKFPFKDASGNMFVGGIGVDITRQKQVEQALKEAKERNELYVDLMGHDINNINQVAMGNLELALESSNNGDKEFILNALEALKSSSSLIQNVQKLKKLKRGGLRSGVIDLNEVLLELKDQYAGSVDKDVRVNYSPNPGCRVMANGLLKDVFSNLIGNAIKHTPEEHVTINIRLNRYNQDHKKYYKLTVEDDGPGIPDELKQKVFNRLERGNTKARGKGLGLYLVKTLVDDFHGEVWVEDRVKGDSSQGSRFVVLLPAFEAEAGMLALPHIGVVEDDGTLLNLYKMVLAKNGMPVDHTAMNGFEAVDMVKHANLGLDVIVMDHRMPGMTGLEAMREIRKTAPGIKFIFISADASIENEALQSGASIFLHKPVKPKDIVQAVNDVLKTDEQRRSANN